MPEDPTTEKKGDGITIKLDIPRSSLTEALEKGVEARMLADAVNYMVTQITPEMMHAYVTKLMEDALKNFSSWKVREILEKAMAPMIEEYLKRPEVLAFLRQNVEKGINEAVDSLPDTVKKKLIERAVDGMTKAWRA
jgi:uncharacterized membrane-anchored protein YjiN (DUF445 family)